MPGIAKPWAHLYGPRWRKARLRFLKANPSCSMCQDEGKIEPATVVDHHRPHRGDLRLFWDQGNWRPLCATHHSSTKQRAEANPGAFLVNHAAPGADSRGMPLDPSHPWAQQARRAGIVTGDR